MFENSCSFPSLKFNPFIWFKLEHKRLIVAAQQCLLFPYTHGRHLQHAAAVAVAMDSGTT